MSHSIFGYDRIAAAQEALQASRIAESGMQSPNIPDGFVETFSDGVLSKRWQALSMPGFAAGNLRLERERVVMWDGTDLGKRKVLSFYARGDRIDPSIVEPASDPVGEQRRVGAALVSRDMFASGSFEIDISMKGSDAAGTGFRAGLMPAGVAVSCFLQCAPRSGRAVGLTSEIDLFEIGLQGDFSSGCFNTWLSPSAFDVRRSPLPHLIVDGRTHRFTVHWETALLPLPMLRDADVRTEVGVSRLTASFAIPESESIPPWTNSEFIKVAVLKKIDGKWNACLGKKVEFWMDGRRIRTTTICPSHAGHLVLAMWTPKWASPPGTSLNFNFAKISVSRIAITPATVSSDVYEEDMTPRQVVPLNMTDVQQIVLRPVQAELSPRVLQEAAGPSSSYFVGRRPSGPGPSVVSTDAAAAAAAPAALAAVPAEMTASMMMAKAGKDYR